MPVIKESNRTPNTNCFLCKKSLYKSPNLFKKVNKFACSECKGEARRLIIKQNPEIYKNMVKAAKKRKGVLVKPENYVCPKCGGKKSYTGKQCFNCAAKAKKGENSHLWKGGVTSESRKQRVKFHSKVRMLVFERDDYTCQMCEKRGVELHVDHIQKWSDYPDLRFKLENCRTLCVDCHYKLTWGKEKPKSTMAWGRNFAQIGGQHFC